MGIDFVQATWSTEFITFLLVKICTSEKKKLLLYYVPHRCLIIFEIARIKILPQTLDIWGSLATPDSLRSRTR